MGENDKKYFMAMLSKLWCTLPDISFNELMARLHRNESKYQGIDKMTDKNLLIEIQEYLNELITKKRIEEDDAMEKEVEEETTFEEFKNSFKIENHDEDDLGYWCGW